MGKFIFEKKGKYIFFLREHIIGGCVVKSLAGMKQKKWFVFCTWNAFNLCCGATKCSPPNISAERLSLEIHFLWRQHSSYRERLWINTKAFSSAAHISLLHFWLLPLPYSLFLTPTAFLFLFAAPISFFNTVFFHAGSQCKGLWFSPMQAGCKFPAARWKPRKWKPHNGDATHDRRQCQLTKTIKLQDNELKLTIKGSCRFRSWFSVGSCHIVFSYIVIRQISTIVTKIKYTVELMYIF